MMQEALEDDRVQAEGAEGVQREVTLLQSRLRLLATYALVSALHHTLLLWGVGCQPCKLSSRSP